MKPWNAVGVTALWALCMLRSSIGFSNNNHQRLSRCDGYNSFIATSRMSPRPHVSNGRLWAQAFNETAASKPFQNNDDSGAVFNTIKSLDVGRISWDVLALLVAFELEGLVDAINEPEFLAHGGWLQAPPPMVDSTLPTLVQRLSVNSVIWIFMACLAGAVNLREPESDNRNNILHGRTQQSVMAFLGFLILRLLLVVATSGDWNGAFFEIYFAALALGTVRVVQKKLYG